MVLKKPSQLFESKKKSSEVSIPIRTSTPLMNNFNETFDRFKGNLDKVDELYEKINVISENLDSKLSKTDLEGVIFSHLVVVEKNFKELEEQFQIINKKTLSTFKEDVKSLNDTVENLIQDQLPIYKKKVTESEFKISKKFDGLQESLENNIAIVDENFQELNSNLDFKLSEFDSYIQEIKNDVLKSIKTYEKLRKIFENKIIDDDKKIEEYSSILESFNEKFIKFEEKISSELNQYDSSFELIIQQLNENVENYNRIYDSFREEVNENYDSFREEVNDNVLNIKADVVINEQHLKKVEKFLDENHQELIDLKEEVFNEIDKIPYGDIQENIERLNQKLEYIEEVYRNIEPEVIVKEVIQESLNEPPSTTNQDPLTPLDQNFVTLEQLQQHYRLFINRIQQQISTLGGGGETRLKYLDDIVGISTNPSAYDGKFLTYNHSIRKFEFVEIIQDTDNIETKSITFIEDDSPITLQKAFSVTTNTVDPVSIHMNLPVADYASVEYLIQASKGKNTQTNKIISVNNAVSINNNEVYSVSTDSTFINYDINISDGRINLVATALDSFPIIYNVSYIAISRPIPKFALATENEELILTEDSKMIQTEID